MTWNDIPGWFGPSAAAFYTLILDRYSTSSSPATFVEVGSWKGRSTACMTEQIQRRQLPVTFYAVDHWRGSESEPEMTEEAVTTDIYGEFTANLSRLGLLDLVLRLRMLSTRAALRFSDASVDFCFIDGDHSLASVLADIRAWRPKIKPNGILAGHDIDMTGVRTAVTQEFGEGWRELHECWMVEVEPVGAASGASSP